MAKRRDTITAAELAVVLGLTVGSVRTILSRDGHVLGLKPVRVSKADKRRRIGFRVDHVALYLLEPLERLEAVVSS